MINRGEKEEVITQTLHRPSTSVEDEAEQSPYKQIGEAFTMRCSRLDSWFIVVIAESAFSTPRFVMIISVDVVQETSTASETRLGCPAVVVAPSEPMFVCFFSVAGRPAAVH